MSCELLASWILSIKFGIKTVLPLPKEPNKMDLFPAFDQCWNSSVLESFVELHNTLPGIYTTRLIPGKRTPQKKHTDRQILGSTPLCIHPFRYLYEFIDPSSHRSKALAVDRKRPPEFLRAVVAFDSLATQGPEAKQLIAASYICLNKLECQFY